MKLVTFNEVAGGATRIGLVRGNEDRVLDVGAAAQAAGRKLPFDAGDMISLIAAGDAALQAVRQLSEDTSADVKLSAVHLCAPIPRPRKNVFCVGWNYVEHFEEGAKLRSTAREMPSHPAFFSKAPTAVNGPYDPIPFHSQASAQMDWEVELGVIIGRGGRDIAEAQAMRHVFGYTVINDVSWRDIQKRHGGQWLKGKSLDGSCPMGPWIVTAGEIDAGNLRLTSRVDGVTKQDSNTSFMHFKIPRLIAELSLGMTLEPGDILSTGTPAGVGQSRTPPEFMVPGNVLETEIVGLGLMRNRIGEFGYDAQPSRVPPVGR